MAPLSSPSDPHKSSPAEHWPHWFLPTSRKCHPLAQGLLAWLMPLHPSFLPHTDGQIPGCYHTPLLHALSPVVILHPACAYLVNAGSPTRLSTSWAQGRACADLGLLLPTTLSPVPGTRAADLGVITQTEPWEDPVCSVNSQCALTSWHVTTTSHNNISRKYDHAWNSQLAGSCCTTQGAQLHALWWPGRVGWGCGWEGGSRRRGGVYT